MFTDGKLFICIITWNIATVYAKIYKDGLQMKEYENKVKLLVLYDILSKYTDEDHAMNKQALGQHYSHSRVDKIIEARKMLKDYFIKLGQTKNNDCCYGQKNNINYLWLVYKEIDVTKTNERVLGCLEEIEKFIKETYDDLVKILKDPTFKDTLF